MRLKKPYKQCRFCKTQVPVKLFLYCGHDSEVKRRFYRCGFCKSTIYSEKITDKERWKKQIDDPLFEGEKTNYGYKYSGV
jgi:hypothetical protein